MSAELQQVAPIEKNKGGRPRKAHTLVINVRVPDHVYDAYCRAALRVDEDVREVMRTVLTYYAPKA